MSLPQTIQARTSDRTLGKVTRLFNASLQDILNELLQNARRAGATLVKVEVFTSDRSYLSISDNGSGIDDPAILLTVDINTSDKSAVLVEYRKLSGRSHYQMLTLVAGMFLVQSR